MRSGGDDLVRIHRDFHDPKPRARRPEIFRTGNASEQSCNRAIDGLCIRRVEVGSTVRERRSESDGGHTGADKACKRSRTPDLWKRLQDRPDSDEDDHRPRFEVEIARSARLVLNKYTGEPRWRGARRS